jgi:signal transduction histidine kinase
MKKILVIEDEIHLRANTVEILKFEDFNVIEAENGLIGIQLAQEQLPDLILCDVMMPEIDGYGVLTALRQNPATTAIPFIFTTAKASKTDLRQGMELGADDYLTKPFTADELLSAIATRLEKQAARQKAEEDLRKALEKEKQLNELKSRFVSMTSHEFRTPLTSILSSAELLENYGHKWNEEKKNQYLQRIQNSVKNMTALMNDVLLLGKAESGNLECKLTQLNLESFCREIVEELQLTASTHTIVFQGQNLPSKVSLDEKLLRHILTNLLSNAIKYSPKSDRVDFEVSSDSQTVIFKIVDYGIGIPAREQEQLFSSFHRASNVGSIAGTGLGLAIVKKAVDLHGGQIEVNSQEGIGTTFTVTLPCTE